MNPELVARQDALGRFRRPRKQAFTAKEVFPTVRYTRNFALVDNFLLLPRAPIGKHWEGKTRIPELFEKHSYRSSQLARCPGRHSASRNQYCGLLKSTAVAHSRALYDTENHHSPHFTFRSLHPLSKCVTHISYKMPNGQTLTLKDSAEKTTSIAKPADHNAKSQTNGANSTSNNADDGLGFEASAFDRSDKKIRVIVQRILPDIPHLVSVPTKNPYIPSFPHENRNTPFEDWEVKHLQHMTLVSNGSRGVAWVKGDWQEEFGATSPYSGARSGTATPQSERDPSKPRIKMSFADYKAGKRPQSSSQPARLTISQTVPTGQSRYDINGCN
jgi:hypothetical protein